MGAKVNSRILFTNPNEGAKQFRNFCKITEQGNPDSKRVIIALGSLIHRTKYAWGNLPEISVNEYDSRFTSFDWPKTSYDPRVVLNQIESYINECGATEIVLAGLSFGDIVVRDLLEQLSPETRAKIKLHISFSGVSDAQEVNGLDKISHYKGIVSSKVTKVILGGFFGAVGKIDRKFLNYKLGGKFVDWEQWVPTHTLKRHGKAASLGFTKGFAHRVIHLLNSQIDVSNLPDDIKNIPVYAVYTDNDPTFKDGKSNAEKIASRSNNGRLVLIEKGGHAALAEQPKKYDDVSRNILSSIWAK